LGKAFEYCLLSVTAFNLRRMVKLLQSLPPQIKYSLLALGRRLIFRRLLFFAFVNGTILDPRAAKGQRYFADVLTALPKMPVTSSLGEVERFIRRVKEDDYFLEVAS
jgi:hypothetical protein